MKNDVKLYEVVDANNDNTIQSSEIKQVQLTSNQIIAGTGVNSGDVTVTYTATKDEAFYVLGLNTDTSAPIGNKPPVAPNNDATFSFVDFAQRAAPQSDPGGITMGPKFVALTLDGAPGEGGEVLSEAALERRWMRRSNTGRIRERQPRSSAC